MAIKSNEKGLTLVEMLISISVGSIVILLLMSILTTTLLTKNIIDYTNKLDNEIYYINQTLTSEFSNMGFKSVRDMSDFFPGYEVLVFSEEFEPIIDEQAINYESILDNQKTLIYAIDEQALYFAQLSVAADINDDAELLDRIESIIENPGSFTLTEPRTRILEGSTIRDVFCLTLDSRNRENYQCASALVKLYLIVDYEISEARSIFPKEYHTSIIY